MPGGRPTDYGPEVVGIICSELAQGKSLREICRREDMPALSSVFLWLSKHKEFSEQYTRAREAGVEALAEETLEIADEASNDWMERNDPDNPGYVVNGEHIQRSRLRVDTRKWLLSKIAPKKYGDKVTNEHTGPDGGPILQRIERVIVENPSDTDS